MSHENNESTVTLTGREPAMLAGRASSRTSPTVCAASARDWRSHSGSGLRRAAAAAVAAKSIGARDKENQSQGHGREENIILYRNIILHAELFESPHTSHAANLLFTI